MPKGIHQAMLERLVCLPTAYRDYCGEVERRARSTENYPDCSSGCEHFKALAGPLGADWVVCANPDGPRFGLLTFEHQAGYRCFVLDPTAPDPMSGPEWTVTSTP